MMFVMPMAGPGATSTPRCSACDEVVGVYERAIFLFDDGSVVDGSPLVVSWDGVLVAAYHLSCSPPHVGRP